MSYSNEKFISKFVFDHKLVVIIHSQNIDCFYGLHHNRALSTARTAESAKREAIQRIQDAAKPNPMESMNPY